MTSAVWQPLQDECSRWADSGLRMRMWMRDDDVTEPSAALNKLNELSQHYNVPLTLAAIPAYAGTALAEFLSDNDLFSVAVHGWSHTNYAPAGQKKMELGLHRPLETVSSELRKGFELLGHQFARNFVPVLVPPWNRIDPSVVIALPEAGYTALSVFGQNSFDGFPVINTHVDLIDWHGSRSCLDTSVLVDWLVRELTLARHGEQHAIGILTHHLVHDEAAWSFLNALFDFTQYKECEWIGIRELLAENNKM